MGSLNLKQNYYIILVLALALVYVLGLFVPLMDDDPSHHADIALHMYLTNDYVHLITRGKDYLDKPHLLFWSAAIFYHLFGVNTLAYKLPSFLVTCLGTYATYRLGSLLYNVKTGVLAALITVSAQAYILANNDVRMDAMLTGFIIFAIWQLAEAVYADKWRNYLFASLGMALAFASKSIIGIAMPLTSLLFLLAYQRSWHKLINRNWIYAALLLLIFISPVLYCFYLQFDLHPEKHIRGSAGISGIKFILFDQSVERLNGENFGKGKNHPFFFLHTMLWAFFPWAFITYYAIFSRLADLIRDKFKYVPGKELLTLGTIIPVFILISSSGFQLPHYLNILFPLFGIITANKLLCLQEDNDQKLFRFILPFQAFITVLYVALIIFLNTWIFPVSSIFIIAISVFMVMLFIYLLFKKEPALKKIVALSLCAAALGNILLNGNFYPHLLKFQSGIGLARVLKKEDVDVNRVYKFNTNSYSLDFYISRLIPEITGEQILRSAEQGREIYLYTNKAGKQKLAEMEIPLQEVGKYRNAKISKLKPKFLNPKTRSLACDTNFLVKVEHRMAAK